MASPLVPSDILRIVLVSDPQIAPDGSAIYYRRSWQDEGANETRSAIHRVDRNGVDRAFTRGTNDRLPRVAPDGSAVAFVADRDDAARLFVLPLDGGEALELGAGWPKIAALAWSPDASRIALVATAPHDPATARAFHDEKSDARHIRILPFKSDADGLLDGTRKHVFVVDRSGGAPRRLTEGDFDAGPPAWSPYGKQIAFAAHIGGPETGISAADVCVVDVAGAKLTHVTQALGTASSPVFSGDGRELAYVGHLHGDDGGGRFDEELLIVPVAGGGPRSLSAGLGRTVGDALASDLRSGHASAAPVWTDDDREIIVQISDEGSASLRAFARDGSGTRTLVGGERHVFGFTRAGDGTLAFAVSTPVVPNEIGVIEPYGGERLLTNVNPWLSGKIVVAPRRYRPRADDGAVLDGWLMAPAQPNEEHPPLVLEVHGGPHAAYGATFFFEFQVLAAQGMAVAYGNPRGSQSYGHAYANAAFGDWGDIDAGDVLRILDGALALGNFDTARIGLAGGSYGGFMTSWLLGHSDRFAAGVSMRAVNDFVSEIGASDIGWFLERELATRYEEDAGQSLFERSPMRFAAAMHAPLLIEHSERDYRCPIDQGEQLFTILRRLGRTETEFVRFADTGHELSRSGKPRSRVLRLRSIANWFVRHLRPAGVAAPSTDAGALFHTLAGEAETA